MPDVRLDCIKELGYALMYMNYIHPYRYVHELDRDSWHDQRLRVQSLCQKCAQHQYEPGILWWDAFLVEIRDEIENMC